MKLNLTNNSALPPELQKYLTKLSSTYQDIIVCGIAITDASHYTRETNAIRVTDVISIHSIASTVHITGNEAIELGEVLIAVGKAHNARLQREKQEGGES